MRRVPFLGPLVALLVPFETNQKMGTFKKTLGFTQSSGKHCRGVEAPFHDGFVYRHLVFPVSYPANNREKNQT